jgi:hydroxymethylbilane synthase
MKLVIATRGSELALWQANHVKARLEALGAEIELSVIKTTGDKILDRPLAEVGGKGLFVKEIEQALQGRQADLAVHSMKDVPAELAPGLVMAAVSEREDVRDALVTRDGAGFAQLAPGSRVGTSSLRRICQLRALRGDLVFVPLRGNVPTRIVRVMSGQVDAAVLAAAGLKRLGRANQISELFDPALIIPAGGQGALGIETRADDTETSELVRRALHHDRDAACVAAERAVLARLQGGCQTPLAAHARLIDPATLELHALVGRPDGTGILRAERVGAASDPAALGSAVGTELLSRGADHILRDLSG